MRLQVRQMLIGRAAQRITIEGIRAHAWLAAGASSSSPSPEAGSHAAARRSRFSTLGPASLQACPEPHLDLGTRVRIIGFIRKPRRRAPLALQHAGADSLQACSESHADLGIRIGLWDY